MTSRYRAVLPAPLPTGAGYLDRPVLLAEGAHDAIRPGVCPLCRHVTHPGQRVASLTDGRGLAHVSPCITGLPGQAR